MKADSWVIACCLAKRSLQRDVPPVLVLSLLPSALGGERVSPKGNTGSCQAAGRAESGRKSRVE